MRRPTLSLCVIAKNEAQMLPDCLASVREVVDQIVVADTGSTDRTVAIAEAAGAIVVHHVWQDDFAAARNAAMAAATGEYLLILDADERLAPNAAAALHRILKEENFDLGFLPLHNASMLNATAEDVLSGKARKGEPILLPRLLKKDESLRWEGIIHENIESWFLAQPRRAIRVEAPIIHLGQVESIVQSRHKSQRNLALLRRACVLRPTDPMRRAWLAREIVRTGDNPSALVQAQRAWQLQVDARNAGQRPDVVLPATLVSFLLLESGQPDAALDILQQAQPHANGHPNIPMLWATALLLADTAEGAQQAIGLLEQCIQSAGRVFLQEILPGATSWAAWTQLGVAYLQLEKPAKALRCFTQALSSNSGYIHAIHGAAETLVALHRPAEALGIIEPTLKHGTADGWLIAAQSALTLQQYADARTFLQNVRTIPTSLRRQRLCRRIQTALEGQTLLTNFTDPKPPQPPRSVQPLLTEGEKWFEQGKLNEAAAQFVLALEHAPGSAKAWCNLGVTLHAAQQQDAAIRALNMSLRQDPTDQTTMRNLALTLMEQGHHHDAVLVWRRLLSLQPDHMEAQQALITMDVLGEAKADLPPLLTVLVTANTAEEMEQTLDALSMQDLHPSLFEVIAISPAPDADPRPYRLQLCPESERDVALANVNGRWLLLLRSGALPPSHLLRRHLMAQAATAQLCAIQGGIEDIEHPLSPSTLPMSLRGIKVPHRRLSNISLPSIAKETLSTLRWQPANTPFPIQSLKDTTCPHIVPGTVNAALAEARQLGEQAYHAWRNNPALELVDILGPSEQVSSWLATRALVERQAPLIERLQSELETLHFMNRSIPAEGLAPLLQQSRRIGLLQAGHALTEHATNDAVQLTSIVVIQRSAGDDVRKTIDSFRRHTTQPVELLVIDLTQQPENQQWLSEQRDIAVLSMPQDTPIATCRNHGLAHTQGAQILFCDAGIECPADWHDVLVKHLHAWPDIAMVSPLLASPEMPSPNTEEAGSHRYPSRLPLSFVLIRRAAFFSTGGFDERPRCDALHADETSLQMRISGNFLRIATDCVVTRTTTPQPPSPDDWAAFRQRWNLPAALEYRAPLVTAHPTAPIVHTTVSKETTPPQREIVLLQIDL